MGRSPFKVDVDALHNRGGVSRRVVLDEILAELSITDAHVEEDEPIHVEVVLEPAHEGVLVSGTVSTRWVGTCRRCLEKASGQLRAEVRELCVEDGDEETTYPLGTDSLDLEPIVHDACILSLPLAPLCAEGCLGLCPNCGVNRNLEHCSCQSGLDPRFAPLSALLGIDESTREPGKPPATN